MRFKRATLRYGETPTPITPYQKAAQVWDERIGAAAEQQPSRGQLLRPQHQHRNLKAVNLYVGGRLQQL